MCVCVIGGCLVAPFGLRFCWYSFCLVCVRDGLAEMKRESSGRSRSTSGDGKSDKDNGSGVVCYFLVCPGTARTYIGVTNDLKRRLRQHNGEISGGAKYTTATSAATPATARWKPVMVVGGFETRADALRFEWKAKRSRDRRVISGVRRRADRLVDLVRDHPTAELLQCDCLPALSGDNVRWVTMKYSQFVV